MTSIITLLYACNVVLLLYPHQTFGLKDGAPATACLQMSPKHPKLNDDTDLWPQQTGKCPFVIDIEFTELLKDQKQVITLKSEEDSLGRLFRGFLVQVREVNDNTTLPRGTFLSCPLKAQPVRCTDVPGADVNVMAVTHTSGLQSNEMKFEWSAPSSGGNFQAYATFVENKRTFWVQQESVIFSAEAGSQPETEILCPPPLTDPSNTCTSMKSSPAFWIILISLVATYECLLRAISLKFKK